VGDHSGPALEDLRVRFNTDVARFEQLEESRVLASIPRTALGKVDRTELSTLIQAP